jgi:hypothetical protein
VTSSSLALLDIISQETLQATRGNVYTRRCSFSSINLESDMSLNNYNGLWRQ